MKTSYATITGTTIYLRRFTENDLDALIALESDPEVMKFTSIGHALSAAESAERLNTILDKNQELEPLGIWAVVEKTCDKVVGWAMLKYTQHEQPELGYMILRSEWGKGFASETAHLLVNYAKHTLSLPGAIAFTNDNNFASQKVLTKQGFKLEQQEKDLLTFRLKF